MVNQTTETPATAPARPPAAPVITAPAGGTGAAPSSAAVPSSCTTRCHEAMGQGTYVHGPVALGKCEACHTPRAGVTHPSKTAHMRLESDFDFKAPGKDLCYACHERKDTQPVVHGPIQWGQCSFCHDPHQSPNPFRLKEKPVSGHETHASKRPKQIRESVPFGRWEIPTNYEKVDTGGRCAPGCHVPRGYDRVTPVANR